MITRMTVGALLMAVALGAQTPAQKLRFDLSAPARVALGREVTIVATLSNVTDERVRTHALMSPEAMHFNLESRYPDGSSENRDAGWLATSSVHTTRGSMRVWVGVPRTLTNIPPQG